MIASGSTIAMMSARLGELGAEQPEQRMVELLTRWLDGGVLAAKS